MRRAARLPLLAFVATFAALAVPSVAAASQESALHASLARQMRLAGASSSAYVVDLSTGRTLLASRASTARIPASVEKLYTTSTALRRFGPAARLPTVVLGGGTLDASGTYAGNLYLKGFGDPTFGSTVFVRRAYGGGASVTTLARRLLARLPIRTLRGRVLGDESWFDARRGTVYSGFAPSADIEGVLSGLAYDRGLANEYGSAFQVRPAAFAAGRLTDALRRLHVRVTRSAGSGVAPRGMAELARVSSPRMDRLVALTNRPSDNYLAEMLIKGLGARFGSGGSTAAGASVVRRALASFGIHTRLVDGSGLSRSDRTTPRSIVMLLRRMASDRAGTAFEASLPVAGVSGTLAGRMRGTAAARRCHAKTGTLSNVSALAGYCHARGGHLLAFAILMNRVYPTSARRLQDRMAAAMAAYRGAPVATPLPIAAPAPAPAPASGPGSGGTGAGG